MQILHAAKTVKLKRTPTFCCWECKLEKQLPTYSKLKALMFYDPELSETNFFPDTYLEIQRSLFPSFYEREKT
jgi:hypothetical protein